jgi:hypothetical protein
MAGQTLARCRSASPSSIDLAAAALPGEGAEERAERAMQFPRVFAAAAPNPPGLFAHACKNASLGTTRERFACNDSGVSGGALRVSEAGAMIGRGHRMTARRATRC